MAFLEPKPISQGTNPLLDTPSNNETLLSVEDRLQDIAKEVQRITQAKNELARKPDKEFKEENPVSPLIGERDAPGVDLQELIEAPVFPGIVDSQPEDIDIGEQNGRQKFFTSQLEDVGKRLEAFQKEADKAKGTFEGLETPDLSELRAEEFRRLFCGK